jgi:hypothetical protein
MLISRHQNAGENRDMKIENISFKNGKTKGKEAARKTKE